MIVNELTNRELIARQYTFKAPRFLDVKPTTRLEADDSDEGFIPYGSTVFGQEITDIQNQIDLRQNELAMKKSKDVTQTFKSRKEMFDRLNVEEEDQALGGTLAIDDGCLAEIKSRNLGSNDE